MKLLYASINHAPNDFYEAFKEKFDVRLYAGASDAIEFNPDVIHIHSGCLDPIELTEIKKHIKPIVTQFTGDASTGLLEPVTWYKGLADLTLLTVGIGHKERYENYLEHEVRWMPEAIRADQCHEPKKDVDKITFIGNYYDHLPEGPTRLEICQILAKEYPDRFQVYGSFPEGTNCKGQCDYELSHGIYNNSYIGIAQDNFNIPGYFSHRYLGIMANTLCLGRHIHEIEDFPMLIFGKNTGWLPIVINEIDQKSRYDLAIKSHEFIKNNYLYTHWVDRYIKHIETL